MRYAALIALRLIDGLHWCGCEAITAAGTAYWWLRWRLVRYLSKPGF